MASQRQPQELRLQQLLDAHDKQRQAIIVQIIKLLLGMWGGFGGWNDDDLMNVAAGRAANYAMSATRTARRLTLAYNRQIFSEFGIDATDLTDIEDIYPRSGVSPLEAHRRPALQYRYARSTGSSEAESLQVALKRATALGTTDVRAAGRDESHRNFLLTTSIIGWRRIVHPELSRTGPCGLCIVASDRFYSTSDLEELHGGCVCGKLPVIRGEGGDPGHKINRDDLNRVYAAAGGTQAEALKRTRVIVRENGEIGPVLVLDGDNFRDHVEAGSTPYSPPTEAEHRKNLLAMKESLAGTTDRLQSRLASVSDSELRAIQAALRANADSIAAIDKRLTLS